MIILINIHHQMTRVNEGDDLGRKHMNLLETAQWPSDMEDCLHQHE